MTIDQQSRSNARRPAERPQPRDDHESHNAEADPFTASAPRVPVRNRRQPKLIAIGILAICLGGLGAAALYTQAVAQQKVIMVAKDIPRGQQITDADLSVIELSVPTGVSAVPADVLTSLVGQTARADLVAGSVLPEGAIGTNPIPAGTAVVGLRLVPGRLPANQLVPGAPLRLVPVPSPQSQTTEKPSDQLPIAAELASTPVLAPDQASWLIDVHVSAQDARTVAELAASDQLAVIHEASR